MYLITGPFWPKGFYLSNSEDVKDINMMIMSHIIITYLALLVFEQNDFENRFLNQFFWTRGLLIQPTQTKMTPCIYHRNTLEITNVSADVIHSFSFCRPILAQEMANFYFHWKDSKSTTDLRYIFIKRLFGLGPTEKSVDCWKNVDIVL